jgi:long-chain acyl-CoA synthetase
MTEAMPDTVTAWLDHWVERQPDRIWLRDRKGEDFIEWSWKQAAEESYAIAAWLESTAAAGQQHCAILSRNRAHWSLADLGIIASGNVTVPLFTTLPPETVRYILAFAEVRTLFLGESENWEKVCEVVPDSVTIVTLPGVETSRSHFRWQEIREQYLGRTPGHNCRHDELMSIIFTSGTTGRPKGVMHTHDSMLIPMWRCRDAFKMTEHPRFLSYLPLSHVAERQAVWIQSLIHGGVITFMEALPTLLRDMVEARPTFFFGAPRVWEQLQQFVLGEFGSQEALDKALEDDESAAVERARAMVGLQEATYLLTGAAPSYAGLIRWWERLGLRLMDGYGCTEAMGLIGNTAEAHRTGSIGKPVGDVEAKITESGELVCRAPGLALGYYRRPKETADTFVDGWIHTGDKARVDEDGFYYITGRVHDYFKTIHGKYVAPVPIEAEFSQCRWVDQLCLLGRGYSKTVLVCVLSEEAVQHDRSRVERDLRAQAERLNSSVEKHARIGGIIIANEPWTIDNGTLTPTQKLRRPRVESRYGEQAEALARKAAEQGEVLVWGE